MLGIQCDVLGERSLSRGCLIQSFALNATPRGSCADRPTHLLAIHAESEECADEEVHGDAWVAGFHLGYAGLARADEVGDVGLGVAEGLSLLAEQCGEGEVELDVVDVFVGEVEELFGSAEFPTLGFEATYRTKS
jgi:hypothetical protein